MSGSLLAAIVIAGITLVLLAIIVSRRRVPDDHVEEFRRQIDALSAESRRPTIHKMKPSAPPAADDDGDDVT